MLRGGSWDYIASSTRAANRSLSSPDYRDNYSPVYRWMSLIGFRVARTAP